MNKDIINKRWKEIDNELSKYLKNNKSNVKERVQGILEKYKITSNNLYSYLNDLKIFRLDLQDALKLNISEYLRFRINKMLERTKIKYIEIIPILIEISMYQDNVDETSLIYKTSQITSEIVQKESCKVLRKKYHLIPFPNYLIPYLMASPLYLGYDWVSYKQGAIQYNADKLYRKIVVDLQQKGEIRYDDYTHSLDLDRKRYITALDNEIVSICNQVSLWGMKKQGIEKVQFIAVMDEKTTNICESMNMQVFSINDWNIYYRFADNKDVKMTKYETKGLKIGENMPALHYNCRSVLYPYK